MKWDLTAKGCVRSLHAHEAHILSLCFGPYDNGPVITGGADGLIKLWEVSTMAILGVLNEHRCEIRSMCVEPQHRFFSCGSDGVLKVWNLTLGDEIVVRRARSSGS